MSASTKNTTSIPIIINQHVTPFHIAETKSDAAAKQQGMMEGPSLQPPASRECQWIEIAKGGVKPDSDPGRSVGLPIRGRA